jgi:hypothetical protein
MKSVELQINEQISDVNNQELQNSAQNQSNLKETDRASVTEKPKPMRPTPLYIFLFFHIHPLYNEYHFD